MSDTSTEIEEDETGMTVPVEILRSPERLFTLLREEVASVFKENS